jgi:hypothetical protein
MTTIAAAEARVVKGEAAIRQREASGRPVPDTWLDAYDQAWRDLLATVSASQERAQAGEPVQVGLGINGGRWA